MTHKLSVETVKENLLDTNLKFYTVATYNAIDSLFGLTLNICLDCLPIISMSYATALVEDLSTRVLIICEEQEPDDSAQEIKTKTHMMKLIDCVNIHVKIKKLTNVIEANFSTIIFIQGLMSSIILCTSVYTLSMVIVLMSITIYYLKNISQVSPAENMPTFLTELFFLIPTLLQTSLPYFFGQFLQDAYGQLNSSLYHSTWMLQDETFKKAMIITMENMKKSKKISAFGIIDVDLKTFRKIFNSAYSLYTVLKSF